MQNIIYHFCLVETVYFKIKEFCSEILLLLKGRRVINGMNAESADCTSTTPSTRTPPLGTSQSSESSRGRHSCVLNIKEELGEGC